MAVVNSDFIAGLTTGFRRLFGVEFEAANNLQPWREIASFKDSTKEGETYNWLGGPPVMVDVTQGEIQIEGLHPFSYNIPNRLYKSAIEVKRTAIEDDSFGLINDEVRELGQEAARHPGQLLFQLFTSGGLAFDAVAFFADTRVIGRSANIDNQIAGGSDPTVVANFQAQLGAARGVMRKFQDDQGRPMNLVGNTIVVPPEMEQVAYQAVAGSFSAGGVIAPVMPATADGAYRVGGYLVMVNPYLTDVNDWYLLSNGGIARPFVYQERVRPTLESLTNASDDAVIRDRYLYSVRARYAVGYGDPRRAIKITNT